MIAIVALLIAYLVAVIGLFRKDRDWVSVVLALLLTAGCVTGIMKERANHRKDMNQARVDLERDQFEEKERNERKQLEADRDRRLAEVFQRVESLSRQPASPQTKTDISALQQDISRSASEMKVVSIHVGGDESKSGVFKYDAPPGYRITDFKLHERSKGGDAHYEISAQTPNHVEVKWSVKSRTVRGPFKMVVNTITAFLTLDASVKLQPEMPAQ